MDKMIQIYLKQCSAIIWHFDKQKQDGVQLSLQPTYGKLSSWAARAPGPSHG